MAYKGIDVSAIQGSVNWMKVKADGVRFCIIKASQGRSETGSYRNFVDSQFANNMASAHYCGIGEISVYHYLTAATDAECDEEAELFCSAIAPYKSFIKYACVDVESKYLSKNVKTLSDIVRRFIKAVEGKGFHVLLYTNPSFLKYRLDENLRKRPLWLAWYTKTTTDYVRAIYPKAVYWQWGLSAVDGIKGKVDSNYMLTAVSEETETETETGKAVSYKVGDVYTMKSGDVYTNGKKVPASLIGKRYTVSRVLTGRILLQEIMSWVKV